MVKNTVVTATTQNMYEFKSPFDMLNNDLNVIYNKIIIDDNINEELSANTQINGKSKDKVAKVLQSMLPINQNISAIELFSIDRGYLYSTVVSGSSERHEHAVWWNTYKNGKSNFVIPYELKVGNKCEHYIIVFREIWMDSKQMSGGIIFYISMTDYENSVIYSGYNKNVNYYIMDNEMNVVYSNNVKTIGMKRENLIEGYLESGYETINNLIIKNKGDMVFAESPSLNGIYTFGVEFNINNYTKKLDLMKIIMCVALALLMIVSLVMTIFVILSMYKKIFNVINIFNDTSFDVNDSKNKIDEVEYLSKNILSMRDKNIEVEEKLAKQIAEIRYYQNVALRMQMNPHFIFNTLQHINVMLFTDNNQDTDATNMISLLSKLIRSAMDITDTKISISREIEYSKQYMELQKIKYSNRLFVNWEIENTVLQYECIPLIIQPLLENSIQYGMRGVLNIKVSIKQQGENVVIIIRDDGAGMSRERLAEVKSWLTDNAKIRTNHVGLYNVNLRHKIIYGDECHMKIQSEKHNGTNITLSFPKK